MTMVQCLSSFGIFLGLIWDFLTEVELPVFGCSAAGLMVGVFLVEASVRLVRLALNGKQGES